MGAAAAAPEPEGTLSGGAITSLPVLDILAWFPALDAPGIGAVAAPEGTFAGGAITSLPTLDILAWFPALDAPGMGAVAAPEGTFVGGAITSLPALEPLASLGLSGKASMCTGVPKSCLPFAED